MANPPKTSTIINVQQMNAMLADLKSPRAYIRTKAIETLMEIRTETAIPFLFRKVTKEPGFVKIQFCRFLGKIQGDLAVPPLITFLLDKSEQVAMEASHALEKILTDRKNESLMSLLRRKINVFPKFFAIKRLGTEGVAKAVPYLINLLSSQEDEVKELTIESLRQIGDPAALHPLLKILETDIDNEKIIYTTILALGEIGTSHIGEKVSKFLSHESAHVRRAAIWALFRAGYTSALPQLSEMLKSDESAMVRVEAVKRIVKLGKGQAVKPLILARVFDEDHNVRVYAEWGLRDIPLEDKEAELLEMAKDSDDKIRGEAILELGRTGDAKFFNLIKNSFEKDKNDYVRSSAVGGLSSFRTNESKEILKEALKDTNEDIRHRAADALLRISDHRDASLAIDMAKGSMSDDEYIQRSGIKSIERIYIGEIAEQEALKVLYELLNNGSVDIQKMVIVILGKIGDRETIDLLRQWRKDHSDDMFEDPLDEAIDRIQRKAHT